MAISSSTQVIFYVNSLFVVYVCSFFTFIFVKLFFLGNNGILVAQVNKVIVLDVIGVIY